VLTRRHSLGLNIDGIVDMWIFTPYGMLSCTQYPEDHEYIQVRARNKKHLIGFTRIVDEYKNYDEKNIINMPHRDYQYRMIIKRPVFAEWMMRYAEKIDYSNFKNKATAVQGYNDYVKMLTRIWEDGMDTMGENREEYFNNEL
jgi:hypothetical protein